MSRFFPEVEDIDKALKEHYVQFTPEKILQPQDLGKCKYFSHYFLYLFV